ncbi:MAG: iron ABC transporter permease [Paludibacterium sp.]|uniref:FecCD family ABC transporter permease n=1 Tax=Paludibacterium sp. TaxID=1917523 RepID=UPI0025D407C3|nr:iron ABC transporter permease [Paludibacterium sp.]MBV8045934.1 iron ABC transporter permease [Paludibacterium sp.]MBV8647880.1 iron ABC transporter permease [Paludibacterium sp.]
MSARHHALALGATTLILVLLCAQYGAVAIRWRDWLAPFNGPLTGSGWVLWQLRLPRLAFALLVGAALGLAGSLTQGLFRNPLADPGLLGVTSGAACAAALCIVLAAELALPPGPRLLLLPVAAFAGALGVCLGLERLARWLAPGSLAGLLLCGIALNALAGAVVGLCTYLADDEQLRSLSFWTLGSLAAANWTLTGLMALIIVPCLWRLTRLNGQLNALALGEAVAGHLGVSVARLRGAVVLRVALLAGIAVAWCGMIGFIGLIAPHIARRLAGADQRQSARLAMLIGALLLLLADTLARSLAAPADMPVGLFSALLGVPFFLSLLHAHAAQRN